MRVLLDTHVWLWALLAPSKLRPRVVRALQAETGERWLSPVSTWEVLVLAQRGRIELDLPADEWIERALAQSPLIEAPLTHDIVRESGRIELPHRDPADRFLAGTARALNLTLVTADERLLRCKQVRTLSAR